jgi:hypothetical protein
LFVTHTSAPTQPNEPQNPTGGYTLVVIKVPVDIKGKVHPKAGHEDPDGEKRYSSILSLTSALDGGGWTTPRPGRFTPSKGPVLTVLETG